MMNKFFKIFLSTLIFPFITLSAQTDCIDGWKASLELLLWSAQQSGSDNWGQIFENPSVNKNIEILDVPFGINAGVRGSLSKENNSYETLLKYTWFSQTGNNQAQVNNPSYITSSFEGNLFIGNSDGSGLSGPTYRFAKISWNICFNMTDFELASSWYSCRSLKLRPFIGIKGGSINQTINTYWAQPTTGSFTATEDLKNNFWGIGPSIGIDTNWHLIDCLSLFGNVSGALVIGRWTFYDTYKNTEPKEIIINNPTRSGTSPMLSLFIGAQYNINRFNFKVGYEAQIWFEQFKLDTYNLALMNNHLTLQGATIGLDYKF